MNSSAFKKAELLVQRLKAMSPKERNQVSKENMQRTEAEHVRFLAAFEAKECYICQRSLSSFGKKKPCLHWLLKPKGFKKNDFPDLAKHYGFFQIQTYLRWVANTHAFAKNINDLLEEGTGNKILELTIRYRNLEWAFSCADSDYLGHQSSQHAKHAHYHFQMRVDQRPFIDYSDFHVPFSEGDILSIEARRRLPHLVKHKFPRGEGMAEILNDNTVDILVAEGLSADDEADAGLSLDTFIIADEGKTISGEDLYAIMQEAKNKAVTVASLIHKLPNTRARTIVTPGAGVVEQASRGGRKKRT